MTRLDPPPLAAWLLEHCIPGQRDQALAGDLLEEFQGGRSHGWYWRQALAAVLVGWIQYLGNRTSLIVFAMLWSMLAPAWAALVDRVQNHGSSWPVEVAAWLGLNLVFVWTGMLLFACLHRQFAHASAAKKLLRAFGRAAGAFLPAYIATFILANLFLWPGLEPHLRGASPLSEIVDLRLWADALRLPYFVTFLASMWGVAPLMAASPVAVLEWASGGGNLDSDAVVEPAARDPYAVNRMFLFLVGTGLLNALIAGFVLCRLPEAQHPTVGSVALRAIAYVAVGAVAGIIGSYLYWHNPANSFRADPPLPFPLFALVCAAGWVWVPAMVLFSEQLSAFSVGVCLVAALLLAGEIRRVALLVLPPGPEIDSMWHAGEAPLFAESLYRAPAQPDGYLLALCLYGAGWALAERWNMTAATLLAMGACLFKFRTTFPGARGFRVQREYRRAVSHLLFLMLPAVFVTYWALLDGVAHRNQMVEAATGEGVGKAMGHGAEPAKAERTSTHVGSGYESVILWPYPVKKEIVAPVAPAPLLAPGSTQPVVIRFSGEYWYLQPPDVRPGPRAHRASGTPLDLHIASANSFPLNMQAHQHLRSPVRVARCRQIRVEIENRETEAGIFNVALWLKNSSDAVYLGQQPLTAAGRTTLTFAVPSGGKMKAFDELAVMILPDRGHDRVGPRVAVEEFELTPR